MRLGVHSSSGANTSARCPQALVRKIGDRTEPGALSCAFEGSAYAPTISAVIGSAATNAGSGVAGVPR